MQENSIKKRRNKPILQEKEAALTFRKERNALRLCKHDVSILHNTLKSDVGMVVVTFFLNFYSPRKKSPPAPCFHKMIIRFVILIPLGGGLARGIIVPD